VNEPAGMGAVVADRGPQGENTTMAVDGLTTSPFPWFLTLTTKLPWLSLRQKPCAPSLPVLVSGTRSWTPQVATK